MNSDNTHRNITDFIDKTILTTPRPQASSTVEKKSFRRQSDRNNFHSPIQEKSKESKENMEDSQNVQPRKSNISINENLAMQRILAQKTLERGNSKQKTDVGGLPSYLLKPTNTAQNFSGCTATPTKNDSTITSLDLGSPITTNLAEKCSFEAKEISARSSSFGCQKYQNSETIELPSYRSPSPARNFPESDFSLKRQSIYDKIRKSDMEIAEICDRSSKMGSHTEPFEGLSLPDLDTISISSESDKSWGRQDSLISKLQNELFTPAELAGDKLLADELSWRKNKDLISVNSFSDTGSKRSTIGTEDLSCFIVEGDLSLKSKLDENMSIGEYFKRKTENVMNLELKASPEKRHIPIPLIDITAQSTRFDESLDNSVPRLTLPEREREVTRTFPTTTEELSRMSTASSVFSMSAVARALQEMDFSDTPGRFISNVKKNKKKNSEKTNLVDIIDITESPTPSSESSTLKLAQSQSESSTLKLAQSQNTSSTLKLAQCQSESSILKPAQFGFSQERLVKENINSGGKTGVKHNTKSILKDTSNILEKYVEENKINEEKGDVIDNDWMDAKQNSENTPENNKTLSSITESPSYSCSELEFSEDDQPLENNTNEHSEEWIKIKEEIQPHKVCVNVPYVTEVHLSSITNRWLLVKVLLKEIKHKSGHKKIAKIEFPSDEGLLKYGADEHFNIVITSLVYGKIEVILLIQITDMVTKYQKQIEHVLFLESEDPQVGVSVDTLNFEILPEECVKKLMLVVSNNSKIDLPLCFSIVQEHDEVFSFCSEEKTTSEIKYEMVNTHSCLLSAGNNTQIWVAMQAPKLSEINCTSQVAEIKGKILIHVPELSKILKEISIVGCVGMCKIQFRTSCVPLILTPGQTKAVQLKNSGVVTMNLTAKIADNPQANAKFFVVENSNIILKPNQTGSINITFTPSELFNGTSKRSLRFEHPGGPSFLCPVEGITTNKEKSPQLKKSPGLGKPQLLKSPKVSPSNSRSASPITSSQSGRSSSSSDTGTYNYLQEGKLPIESTKSELVWGCVKPGKNSSQEFVLRNRVMQRVRLQASITGAAEFKLIKDQAENVNSLSLVLHGMESRTINVNFAPSSIGSSAAKLMFIPLDGEVTNSKRQLISLYGYGGYCCVDVQKVAKDTSGKMWLSFGRLDYRGILQQTFILRNTGSISAFAVLNVHCKTLYPFMDSSVKISPTEVVIQPNKEVDITVTFTPRQEDFKYIHTTNGIEVSEIATVHIRSGPEPTRGRIRRLSNKMMHQGGMPQLTSDYLIPKICGSFPGEQMPSDLNLCRERAGAMKELLRDIVTREVALTVELDPEKGGFVSVIGDDTCMFQTLCNETEVTITEPNISHTDNQQRRRISGGFCTVEPRKLMLTPPIKMQDTVLLSSKHSRPMPFEITIPACDLQVNPHVGVVPPGETTVITISCSKNQPKQLQFFKIMVYMENEVMEIEVKIHAVQPRRT